uniref:reverse transcriptase domain-containing protein n=1 Tax=Rhizobium meliloti TaxID=382 RepID=UPI001EFF1495|nr:reverse transcriptase domain-containing protein [Sinorhizobium meliloti]
MKTGGERVLGVPTVSDRIAQMVVKQMIEPDLEPLFLPDSYGYRPMKSALDAVGVTRQRCWKYDWDLEFDIEGLFDNLPHDLLLKAVRKDVKCIWALLYIERWLTAPMEKNGEVIERTRGIPQEASSAQSYRTSSCRSALSTLADYVNRKLKALDNRKFKRFKSHKTRASLFLRQLTQGKPWLFAHGEHSERIRSPDGSGVNREVHASFCDRPAGETSSGLLTPGSRPT